MTDGLPAMLRLAYAAWPDYAKVESGRMDNAKSVFAGWGTALVIKDDNSLWGWGDNMPGTGEDRLTLWCNPGIRHMDIHTLAVL